MGKTITIPRREYLSLKTDELKLQMLECAGVDNWEWYGEALNPDSQQSFSDLEDELKEEILGSE